MTRWKWVNGVKNDEWLKKGRMRFAPTIYLQTEAVLGNPKNPVNPDSEPNDRVKFHLLLTVYSVDRFTIDFKDLKADERPSFLNIVLPK
jgi:hypothetical protein